MTTPILENDFTDLSLRARNERGNRTHAQPQMQVGNLSFPSV